MPLLCIAECFERFAATLLAALLALRLNEHWGRTPGEAARAVAWFEALGYGAGLGGAWLADQVLGLSRATILGALFLTLGYVALTVDHVPVLLSGAGLLLIGHALFKPAVTAWVAALAGPTASGRIAALRWFYFAINVGTVAGALTAAGLRSRCGFSGTLGVAAGSMALAWLLLGRAGVHAAPLPPIPDRAEPVPAPLQLSRLVRTWLVLPLFAAAMCQTSGILLFWARDFTERRVAGHVIPPESFIAVPALLVLLLSPIFSLARPWLRRHGEPSESLQIALGAGLGGLAYLIMLGALAAVGSGRVSPLWLLGCDAALTLGELLLIPASMARLARLAHSRGAARAQSATYLAMALGSGLAGGLAAQWGHRPPAQLFAALAGCCLIAMLLTIGGQSQPGLPVRRP